MVGRSKHIRLRRSFVTAVQGYTLAAEMPHNTARTTRVRFNVRHGLGSSRFARRYYGNRYLLSLPRGTKMFQFPRFASTAYVFSRR